MGGYGSGRWGRRLTKGTTDAAFRLDVRWLARQGLIVPNAAASLAVAWSRGGESAGAVLVAYDGGRPREVVLDNGVEGGAGAPWEIVRERVPLDATPCPYGGERVWFRCPGCGSRRAVLWGAGGRFRCRACHGLAHGSTRETPHGRNQRRADALRRRIGGEPGSFVVPEKPKGMHWRTYERIVAEVRARDHAAFTAMSAEIDAIVAVFERR